MISDCRINTLIYLLAVVFFYSPCVADNITYNKIGNTTFISGHDANGNYISGSSIDVGGTTFHNLNTGSGEYISGTSVGIGSTTFHNLNTSNGDHISGTSVGIGSTTFHNFSGNNGLSANGTSTNIGGNIFNNMNYMSSGISGSSISSTYESNRVSATQSEYNKMSASNHNESLSGSINANNGHSYGNKTSNDYSSANDLSYGGLYGYQQMLIKEQERKEKRDKLITTILVTIGAIGAGWLFGGNKDNS